MIKLKSFKFRYKNLKFDCRNGFTELEIEGHVKLHSYLILSLYFPLKPFKH